MIVICPSCMARYRLEGESVTLPPAGRSMRCGRCGNTWQAAPVDPPPEILPPALYEGEGVADGDEPAADRPASAPQAQWADDDWESAEAGEGQDAAGILRPAEAASWRAHRSARRGAVADGRIRANRARRRWQAFMLGMLLAGSIAALHYRTDVVRAVPASATLYERIGLPVNLRGLDFRHLVARRVFEDGLPVLIIEGEVVNLRRDMTEVPSLRIAVRGSQGEELYVWRVDPRQRMLEAHQSLTLRTRLAIPPGGAQDVELRFVDRGPASLGMR